MLADVAGTCPRVSTPAVIRVETSGVRVLLALEGYVAKDANRNRRLKLLCAANL